MAEEEEAQQEEGQEEESAVQKKDEAQGNASGAGNNSKLVFIVLIVNVVALIGVAAIVWLNLSKSSDSVSLKDIEEQRQTETAHVADGEGAAEGGALQYIEENFMVNLSGSGGNHYAKLGVSIQVENDFVKAELEKIRPKIRDFIIVMLSSKSVEQVSSADGVEFLREEIRNKINGYLTKGEVDQVLVTQFIVQ